MGTGTTSAQCEWISTPPGREHPCGCQRGRLVSPGLSEPTDVRSPCCVGNALAETPCPAEDAVGLTTEVKTGSHVQTEIGHEPQTPARGHPDLGGPGGQGPSSLTRSAGQRWETPNAVTGRRGCFQRLPLTRDVGRKSCGADASLSGAAQGTLLEEDHRDPTFGPRPDGDRLAARPVIGGFTCEQEGAEY